MNDSTIERVLLWMVSGLAGADLETACIAKLDVDPAQVKAAAKATICLLPIVGKDCGCQ